jgi:TonB-linked SusC/RagA family outer membrane protein
MVAASPSQGRGNAAVVLVVNDDGQRVTLHLEKATVKQLFEQIHKQTGMDFMYNTEQVASVSNVSVTAENEPVAKVLERVFRNTDLTFRIDGKMVTVSRKKANAGEQKKRRLVGSVFDDMHLPIIGATVMIKGTQIGTTTDIDGNYAIDVKAGDVLVFSYIGMEPKEAAVFDNLAKLNVLMKNSSETTLQDVVVTGIFKKAKESYTGSVSTVSKEQLQMFKGQNLLQTLKNADASLNFAVNNLTGSNPNDLPSVNIRGNSSLPTSVQEYNQTASNSVNTPLIIMDGFEITLEKLMDYNDDEIENINILKDAAATAIYGSRGANGVIVVTTKQPEAGKLRVNAEIGLDIEAADLSSYNLLNAADKLELERSLGLYNSTSPTHDQRYQEIYNSRLLRVLSGQSTDWISKPIHAGVGSHYNLRLEGGSEAFRWSATANYKDVEGAMKNSSRRTFNGSLTLMYKVKDLTFKNYLTYGMVRANESNYGSFSDYVKQQPYNNPYDENGNIVEYFENFYGSTSGHGTFNPLWDASLKTINKSGYETLTDNFSIEWNITKELILRGQLGITSTDNHSDYFLPANHSYFLVTNAEEYSTDEGFMRRGLYRYGVGKDYQYSGNVTLSYNKTFLDKHQVYVGLDYSLREYRGHDYTFEVEGISNENMSFLGNARQYAQNAVPTGTQSKTRMLGFTGNVNYTYDGRYYLDFSYRIDGSSTFGTDKKYAPFFSTGLGWNLHNEKFLEGNELINILRLKASYGQTGSSSGSSSGANTVYQYQTDNKYMNWMGATLSAWGNPRLTWQKTDEMNLGVEFGLWNGRVKGEFEYYTKKTSNLLSYMDLPLSMGLSSYMANVGEVKNNGWEASASVYVIRNPKEKLSWLLSGQLVYNKNKISKLSDAIKAQNELYLALSQDEDGNNIDIANLFYEGRPQNSIYAVRSLGIDPSTGREIYLDKNGEVTYTWNASDKVYLGSKDPLYRTIFSSMLMWKGFTLNLSFGGYWGGKVYNQTLLDRVEVTTNTLTTSNVDKRVYTDRWMNPGDVTFFKGFSNETTRATSRFVMDDRVLELQSASLQYRWDSDWVRRKLGVQSIIYAINASDLCHWSSVKMERGTSYPYARNIQGSIKLMF